MELNSILAIGNTPSATTGASVRLADSFDTFLKLLTTQLQHQNPLSPMDSTQFTQQLVSFASVEQSIVTNKNLEAMVFLLHTSQVSGAVGYLGKTVTASGNTALLANGTAQWNYSLPSEAQKVSITIKDANGRVVFNGSGATTSGMHTFVWNGLNDVGAPQPNGSYTIGITASNAAGAPIQATTTIEGKVTGIQNAGGKLMLTVNGASVLLEDVTAIKEPPPAI